MSEHLFYSLDGPLDSMPTERQLRAANLSGFPSLIRSLGADSRALLDRHGIDPKVISDPDHYIDCKAVVDLLEYCSIVFNDPIFGLRLAQLQEPDVFGCVTALCRAAPTVRDAINNFIDYIPVTHSPVPVLELVEGPEVAELRWWLRTELGINTQANYHAALLDLKLLRQLCGRNFRPSYVKLAVDMRGADITDIESRLECRFICTEEENAIGFPVGVLDRPVASANRLLYRLLGGYLERVKAASRVTIVERVQDYVRGALSSGNCTIERCAQKLGVSVRTLQTHLNESGLKFSDILEKHRIELAKTYLEQEQLTLDEVALNLGYSEQSSFGRAFKRWTGLTPKLYRRSVLAHDEPMHNDHSEPV